MAKVYEEVNGSKPEYAREGDIIVTGGGSYVVQADGTGKLIDKDTTTYNYKSSGGAYDPAPAVTAPDPNSALMSATWKPTNKNASDDLYLGAYKQQQSANRSATNAAVSGYQSQIPGVNQSYDELAKQEYTNYMLGKKDLREDLSTMGLGTQGVAESSLNQANAAYAGNLNQSELARQNALQSIQSAIAQVKAQGAQNNATIQGDLMQTLAGIQANRESQQQAYDVNTAESAQKTAYNMLLSGYYSDETALAAGLTLEQGKYIANLAKQQMAAKANTGSGSNEPTYTKAQADIALANLQNGKATDNDISILEGYYKMPVSSIASAYGITLPTQVSPTATQPSNEDLYYDLSQVLSGNITLADITANQSALIAMYGEDGYNQLLEAARRRALKG